MQMIAESIASVKFARFDNARPEYTVSAQLRLCETHFCVLKALHSRADDRTLGDEQALEVLEALAVTKDTQLAFERYATGECRALGNEAWAERLPRAPWKDETLALEHGKLMFISPEGAVDLSSQSRAGMSVLLGLLARERVRAPVVERSVQAFAAGVHVLTDLGLLAPPTGSVEWGDLSRQQPFCGRYGSGRGTVIDRYYLARFLDEVGHHARGRTIEVGTTILTENHKLRHPFPAVTDYKTLDVVPGMGVDICGDIVNHSLLERSSIDTILCFNVLEHCVSPQLVVDNMLRWLAPGGKVLCMVPSVQRVHEAPADYWRLLPSGMEYLFRNFRERELHVYGNLQTTIAALSGLAVEDLCAGALDMVHPDYPVATCIVATK
jgi:SAM-dependent methyltransferase